jgi:hypothetical protein
LGVSPFAFPIEQACRAIVSAATGFNRSAVAELKPSMLDALFSKNLSLPLGMASVFISKPDVRWVASTDRSRVLGWIFGRRIASAWGIDYSALHISHRKRPTRFPSNDQAT